MKRPKVPDYTNYALLLQELIFHNQNVFKTRMTTSISSEARENQTSILIRGRENHVSPLLDEQTDRHTDGC